MPVNMKATLIVFFAAIAAPGLSMRLGHSSTLQSSSISTTSSALTSSVKHVHLSPASGGDMNCTRLEAKQKYYLVQIEELQKQGIAVPAYLAGYASAAADSLEMLGCSLNGKLKALA